MTSLPSTLHPALSDLSTSLPWRFRYSSFKRYEQIICAVVKSFPTTISINPKLQFNLSPITFASRFRDALTSYSKHNWPSDIINRERFEKCYIDGIITRESSDLSLIHIGGKNDLESTSVFNIKFTKGNIQIDDSHELNTICKIAQARLLSGEISITFKQDLASTFLHTLKLELEQTYDVSIEYNETTKTFNII